MRIYITASFAVILIIVLFQSVSAQSDTGESQIGKFEAGGQITLLTQQSYNENSPVFDVDFSPFRGRYPLPNQKYQTEFGFGGRFTVNFNRNVAVEVEANYFPVDRLAPNGKEAARIFGTDESIRVYLEPQGRKLQVVAGPKIGYRGKRFGVFGKARPGILYFDRYPVTLSLSFAGENAGFSGGRSKVSFFSLDVGGVAEYYPSRRTVLRFDVGDTIIRYRALTPEAFNPGFTRHSLQTTVGFGYRF